MQGGCRSYAAMPAWFPAWVANSTGSAAAAGSNRLALDALPMWPFWPSSAKVSAQACCRQHTILQPLVMSICLFVYVVQHTTQYSTALFAVKYWQCVGCVLAQGLHTTADCPGWLFCRKRMAAFVWLVCTAFDTPFAMASQGRSSLLASDSI